MFDMGEDKREAAKFIAREVINSEEFQGIGLDNGVAIERLYKAFVGRLVKGSLPLRWNVSGLGVGGILGASGSAGINRRYL